MDVANFGYSKEILIENCVSAGGITGDGFTSMILGKAGGIIGDVFSSMIIGK